VKMLAKLIVLASVCMVVVLILCAVVSSILAIVLPGVSRELAHGTRNLVRGPMHLIGDSGMDVAILALCIPLAAVVGGIFLAALKILKGDSRRKSNGADADEARMMQDIYHGLLKMEERVESLETLLMDRQRKGNNP